MYMTCLWCGLVYAATDVFPECYSAESIKTVTHMLLSLLFAPAVKLLYECFC